MGIRANPEGPFASDGRCPDRAFINVREISDFREVVSQKFDHCRSLVTNFFYYFLI